MGKSPWKVWYCCPKICIWLKEALGNDNQQIFQDEELYINIRSRSNIIQIWIPYWDRFSRRFNGSAYRHWNISTPNLNSTPRVWTVFIARSLAIRPGEHHSRDILTSRCYHWRQIHIILTCEYEKCFFLLLFFDKFSLACCLHGHVSRLTKMFQQKW